jgi:hypothetical protein
MSGFKISNESETKIKISKGNYFRKQNLEDIFFEFSQSDSTAPWINKRDLYETKLYRYTVHLQSYIK